MVEEPLQCRATPVQVKLEAAGVTREREFFIGNLLVRIHLIIELLEIKNTHREKMPTLQGYPTHKKPLDNYSKLRTRTVRKCPPYKGTPLIRNRHSP